MARQQKVVRELNFHKFMTQSQELIIQGYRLDGYARVLGTTQHYATFVINDIQLNDEKSDNLPPEDVKQEGEVILKQEDNGEVNSPSDEKEDVPVVVKPSEVKVTTQSSASTKSRNTPKK